METKTETLIAQEPDAITLAVDLITHFEGLRLRPYKDSGNILTIGYGHTKDVKEGMIITKEKAIEFLQHDLADSLKRFNVRIILNEYEKAALLSLAFNLTWRSFKALESILNEDKEKFKLKMLLYVRDAKGNYLKGLSIRRICERLLFEGKDWKEFAKWSQKPHIQLKDIFAKEKELFKLL